MPHNEPIARDLIEAYCGYHEDLLRWKHKAEFANEPATQDFDQWADSEARRMIRADDARTRLGVWLEWNGILGYTARAFAIAQGEL